jgi:chemotaxis response regulator CheB
MTPLRVLAIDDEALALRRIEIAMSRVPGVELIGTARGGREGLELVGRLGPTCCCSTSTWPASAASTWWKASSQNAPLVIFAPHSINMRCAPFR